MAREISLELLQSRLVVFRCGGATFAPLGRDLVTTSRSGSSATGGLTLAPRFHLGTQSLGNRPLCAGRTAAPPRWPALRAVRAARTALRRSRLLASGVRDRVATVTERAQGRQLLRVHTQTLQSLTAPADLHRVVHTHTSAKERRTLLLLLQRRLRRLGNIARAAPPHRRLRPILGRALEAVEPLNRLAPRLCEQPALLNLLLALLLILPKIR